MIRIHIDPDTTFRFSLETKSGNILLNSIPFSDKFEMDKVIRKLDTTPLGRNHFERKTNTDGKFLFSLKDDEGHTVGHSELYDSEAGMENGIQKFNGTGQIVVMTDKNRSCIASV